MYDYTAAISEECSFRKGDTVLVTKTQDDGWWVGDIAGTRPPARGLVPRYPSPLLQLTIATSSKRCSKIREDFIVESFWTYSYLTIFRGIGW